MVNKIYSVSFHTKSPKRTHTFWFTSKEQAAEFNESLYLHPKVTECRVYEIDADLGPAYISDPENGGIRRIDEWERGQKPFRAVERTINRNQDTKDDTDTMNADSTATEALAEANNTNYTYESEIET